jgi:hypothetical protein
MAPSARLRLLLSKNFGNGKPSPWDGVHPSRGIAAPRAENADSGVIRTRISVDLAMMQAKP